MKLLLIVHICVDGCSNIPMFPLEKLLGALSSSCDERSFNADEWMMTNPLGFFWLSPIDFDPN